MGGQGATFSHGPMSGTKGDQRFVNTYSHTRKVQNWGQGAMASVAPPVDPLLAVVTY